MLTIAALLLTLRDARDLLLEGKRLDRMLCPYELDRLKLEFLANEPHWLLFSSEGSSATSRRRFCC